MVKVGERIAAIGAMMTFGGIVWCIAISTGPIWVPIVGIVGMVLGLDMMTDGGM